MTTSTRAKIATTYHWNQYYRLSMVIIRSHVITNICWSIPECKNIKELLKAIDEQFESSVKSLVSIPMRKLSSMKLTSSKGASISCK